MGWVILECREEVRLGMAKLGSPWSRVEGRSPIVLRGRRLSEGAILDVLMPEELGPLQVNEEMRVDQRSGG